MVEVETARLLLRPWSDEDLEPHARICADPEVMRYMGRGALARERGAERVEGFARHWERHGYGLWAAEYKASGAFIGRIGLLFREDSPEGADGVEVAWLLDRPYWGRGLATEGALASIRHGFEEVGLERIISIALPQNVASRRVMEKAGLVFCGEARWQDHDVVWYAIDRGAWEARGRDPGA